MLALQDCFTGGTMVSNNKPYAGTHLPASAQGEQNQRSDNDIPQWRSLAPGREVTVSTVALCRYEQCRVAEGLHPRSGIQKNCQMVGNLGYILWWFLHH